MALYLIVDIIRMFTGTPMNDLEIVVEGFLVFIAGYLIIIELTGFLKLFTKMILQKLLQIKLK